MTLGGSELILNPDGSVYHLGLLPEDVAPTIITVGDPDRVGSVSKHFDSITVQKAKREFVSHTGHLNGKNITVISTGIGTDNIDIVLNELDALFNIDFDTRQVRSKKTRLNIIRIGTSGTIQPDIPVNSILLSSSAIGFDGLLHFYKSKNVRNEALEKQVNKLLDLNDMQISAYATECDEVLREKFNSNNILSGITVTHSGFYGPQGRCLRLMPSFLELNNKLANFSFGNQTITNFEMETAGIYGLSKLLGHRAVSLNAILTNRATGEFSKNPEKTIENLISFTLERLTS